MRIITSDDLRRENKNLNIDAFFEPIGEALIRKYSGADRFAYSTTPIKSQVRQVLEATGGNLKGRTFLDLGCGSTSYDESTGFDNYINRKHQDLINNDDQKMYRMFEPWLCRALHEAGFNVIGIDIGNLAGEEFTHHSIDLLAEDALAVIPDNSVDYAHSRLLYSSPQLENMINRHAQQCLKRDAEAVMKDILLPQIERVLKPTGAYLCFE